MPKNITEITNNNKYHYNYIITNLNNHMRYIGVRSCDCWPAEDNYWGSCKTLKKNMLKEGKEWFRKDIIALWDTRELAVEHEIKLHNHFEVGVNPMFYNKSKQTSIGFDTAGCSFPERVISEETKKKLSLAKSGENHHMYGKTHTEETKKKLSLAKSGENNAMYGVRGEDNPNYGKTHTEETRKRVSLAKSGENHHMYGKTHTEETKKRMSESHKGKTHTEETKKRMSESKKNKKYTKQKRIECPHCGKIGGSTNMKRWHFDNCKMLNNFPYNLMK